MPRRPCTRGWPGVGRDGARYADSTRSRRGQHRSAQGDLGGRGGRQGKGAYPGRAGLLANDKDVAVRADVLGALPRLDSSGGCRAARPGRRGAGLPWSGAPATSRRVRGRSGGDGEPGGRQSRRVVSEWIDGIPGPDHRDRDRAQAPRGLPAGAAHFRRRRGPAAHAGPAPGNLRCCRRAARVSTRAVARCRAGPADRPAVAGAMEGDAEAVLVGLRQQASAAGPSWDDDGWLPTCGDAAPLARTRSGHPGWMRREAPGGRPRNEAPAGARSPAAVTLIHR